MSKVFRTTTTTGATVYAIIMRVADNYLLNDADGLFASAPADPYLSMTEHGTIKSLYTLTESRSIWDDGEYVVATFNQIGGAPAPASDTLVNSFSVFLEQDFLITTRSLYNILETINTKVSTLSTINNSILSNTKIIQTIYSDLKTIESKLPKDKQ